MVRFIFRLSVGQQLVLQLSLCALPLGYLGYRLGTADATGLALVSLVAAGLVCVGVARRVTALNRRVLAASRALGRGELPATTTDVAEPADRALAELGATLKARFESVDSSVATSARLHGALDKLASNVMVADADGKIVYMNEAVAAMFRANATQIRTQLPYFDAGQGARLQLRQLS